MMEAEIYKLVHIRHIMLVYIEGTYNMGLFMPLLGFIQFRKRCSFSLFTCFGSVSCFFLEFSQS